MALDFEKYVSKGNEFINSLDTALGSKGREHASRVLRSIFRALRSRLSPEQSIHLLAQLPIILKGVYVDGWKWHKGERPIENLYDFLHEMMMEDGKAAWRDFASEQDAYFALRAFFQTINQYISAGEMEDLLSIFPYQLREALSENEFFNP